MLVRSSLARRQLRFEYFGIYWESFRKFSVPRDRCGLKHDVLVEEGLLGESFRISSTSVVDAKLFPRRGIARQYLTSLNNRFPKAVAEEPTTKLDSSKDSLVLEDNKVESRATAWTLGNGAVGIATVATIIFLTAGAEVNLGEEARSQSTGMVVSTGLFFWNSVARLGSKIGKLLSESAWSVVEAWNSTMALTCCLISVFSAASESTSVGSGSWMKPRVAALIADITAHEYRRKAVVEAGGGLTIDWLLKSVANFDASDCLIAQAQSARALSYLLSDENTCDAVFSRPGALPYFLKFASSLQIDQGFQDWSKEQWSTLGVEFQRGRSMLVTAIMDLITSSCDDQGSGAASPKLPENADLKDIAAALQVVREGRWYSGDQNSSDGEPNGKPGSDRKGIHGIGIRVVGGTGVVGVQREQFRFIFEDKLCRSFIQQITHMLTPTTLLIGSDVDASRAFPGRLSTRDWGGQRTLAAAERNRAKYGLWDDLQGRHIAVPLAAWAIANWAQASAVNRAKILELDRDGEALLAAVLAPEKSVKWHGAKAMRLLLETKSCEFSEIAPRWSSALLDIAAQAGKAGDTSLAECALAALTACVSRCDSARSDVLRTGLPIMRKIASESEANLPVQSAVAQLLDVLTAKGNGLPIDESKRWASILLRWVCHRVSDVTIRSCGSRVLVRVLDSLGPSGVSISQAWLALLLVEAVSEVKVSLVETKRYSKVSSEAREREQLQTQLTQAALTAATELGKVIAQEAAQRVHSSGGDGKVAESAAELPMIDLLGLDVVSDGTKKNASKEPIAKVTAKQAAEAVRKAIKALTDLTAEEPAWRQRILDGGVLCLLRRFMLCKDYEDWFASEASSNGGEVARDSEDQAIGIENVTKNLTKSEAENEQVALPQIRKHAARLLSVLALQPNASSVIMKDRAWFGWLESCADGLIPGSSDKKSRSYSMCALLNACEAQVCSENQELDRRFPLKSKTEAKHVCDYRPRYEDQIFLMNPASSIWKKKLSRNCEAARVDRMIGPNDRTSFAHDVEEPSLSNTSNGVGASSKHVEQGEDDPVMDVVFIHGLRGGPFKTWRVSENKASTSTPMVERVDENAGKQGTCWPQEWLADDLPRSRLLTVKYKTNLSEWSGATLPLQEVSSMLLDKLLAAGVGDRPLVFVTHSMGGLVVKQMLLQAGKDEFRKHLVHQTTGVVFYSCPHFGSKLADMPWRIGLVLRPAPTIGELRSGSPKLEELNQFLRQLNKEKHLNVLSFSETKVTPLVEGYGGWGLRMEVVPIESAYPGFGDLVVLPGTDHVNSCKPLNRSDPAYTKTVEFLRNQEVSAKQTARSSVS